MVKTKCLLCGQEFPLNLHHPFCSQCHQPLFLKTSLPLKDDFSDSDSFLEKLFPPPSGQVSLGEGQTPLLRLASLEKKLGFNSLWAKNEGLNPTGTFKDRGTVRAVEEACRLGIKKIGTVSVGNMAASTAAYGARAGLETYILVRGDVDPQKLKLIQTFDACLIQVKGDYGELFDKSYELGQTYGIYFINSIDPLRLAGYKTIAREILQQLAPLLPEVIVVPVSSGGHFLGIFKAFLELASLDFLPQLPLFIGVQSDRCSPLVEAFQRQAKVFTRIHNLPPVPYAISNPNPPGGNLVLHLIYKYKGYLVAVSDEDISQAQQLLALEEGIFALPSSAAALAALLHCQNYLPSLRQKTICLILTGTGWRGKRVFNPGKTTIHQTSLNALDHFFGQLLAKERKKPTLKNLLPE